MKQLYKYFNASKDKYGGAINFRMPTANKNEFSTSLSIIKDELMDKLGKLRIELKDTEDPKRKEELKILLEEYRIAYEMMADLHSEIKGL